MHRYTAVLASPSVALWPKKSHNSHLLVTINNIPHCKITRGYNSPLTTLCSLSKLHLFLLSFGVTTTDIQGRSQTSYTTPCNGVLSPGAQIGGIWVFVVHTRRNKRKQNVSTIFVPHAAFHLHAQIAVHMHLTNHGYCDPSKNPNTPNLSSMPG